MIILRELRHEDYDDVIELCKGIWGGTDYLPYILRSWIDDKEGVFIAAVDTDTNKVIGTDKYSVLPDGTGWLEGIRVHKDYRGRKIAKLLTECVLEHATKDLQSGKVQRIAFSTHESAVESITMMKQYNFDIEQKHIIVQKDFNKLDPSINESDFVMKPWNATYEEFANLPFTLRRNGVFHIAFYFQRPNIEFFNYLKEHNCFVNINGYNGIYLFKGEPYFVTEEESFQAIDTFMNYYLVTLKGKSTGVPLFSIMSEDIDLIEKLKAADYDTWTDWQSDYYYFVRR
ncbi:MAG TPA: GNAT family N-acetyltransferase [Patescibacteria group bacterium]|nr:GNAT family N-acetyltransferase [Patescibacteria group bacterium]